MKKLLIPFIIIVGLYFYFTWKPSASGIAEKMEFGEVIKYEGKEYRSEWGNSENIEGYLRRKDRHYDEYMPIITYDLSVATGEYSDPEIVKIQNKGGGNYYWSSHKQPEGTLVFYHTVPASYSAQIKLDEMNNESTIMLVGKISQNSEIRNNEGNFVKLGHDNHKFILVEDVVEK